MSEEPPDCFVVARMVFQVGCGGSMPKLMHCNPQSGGFLDPFGNLDAEQMRILGFSRRTGEEPIPICTAQEARTILLNIFVDQIGQVVVKLKGQIDAILDIVMRKYQQVGRIGSSRFDQVSSRRMAARFAALTGASVKMAIPTAICAATAALTGAFSFSERARFISSVGQL